MDCVNLRPADLDFMRDRNKSWECSLCVASGRKLRSGSVSSVPANNTAQDVGVSQDNFERLFAELSSIKTMQKSIVDDISLLKQSQTQLGIDLDGKFQKLQGDFNLCCSKLNDHEIVLDKHSTTLDSITARLAQIERDVKSAEQCRRTPDDTLPTALRVTNGEEEVLAEIVERQKRSRNVIVFNLAESTKSNMLERKADDLARVKLMLRILEREPVVSNVLRIGKFDVAKSRPVKIVFQTESEVHDVIKNAGKLRNSSDFERISISFDRTPKQLLRYKALRSELQDRLSKGERGLKIRYVSGTPKIVALN